jgi:hypothetical protein
MKTTYFGVPVYPFGGTECVHDFEAFSRLFIKTGKHRFQT